jgi:Xaa-Pro aminopeptidase
MNIKYLPVNPQLFVENRARFAKEMKPNTIAIFYSNDMMPRCGDQFFPFRQNSDFFHLSGIDQEESVLVLYPDCVKQGFSEVLMVRKTNDHIAIWEGHKYTKEEATATSGIQKVIWVEDMDAVLNEMILLSDGIYLNINENDRFVTDVLTREKRMALAVQQRYPAHTLLRAQPLMKRLRMITSPLEVELIQIACDITEKAFKRVLKTVKPGVWEYEVEAEIMYEFLRNRATGHAYSPIIASGNNANVLHYNQNNQQCKAGDLLLMDFGAEYANYAADLTRTIPVSGRFTARQRAVYDAVLRVMKAAKKLLQPGSNLISYHKAVGDVMENELLQLGLITTEDVKKQDPDWPAYKKYFMHGTSHHLGLDVHDLMDRYATFQVGMVFTVEPGIYIPEEGFGIRLENDVWIREDGVLDLMANIPLEAEEIEDWMNG